MEEMTLTVENVAANVHEAVAAVQVAREKSEHGYKTMSSTIASVGQLATQIDTASQVIRDFEVHSNEIVTVLDVIKGVAEQTNLLALMLQLKRPELESKDEDSRLLPTKCVV